MKDTLWLRDYFTDAEINEYRHDFLAKYFQKDGCGKIETQNVSQGRKRRGSSKAKTSVKEKRQGNRKIEIRDENV